MTANNLSNDPRPRRRSTWRRRTIAYSALLAAWFVACFAFNVADRLVMIPTTHRIPAPGAVDRFIPLSAGQLQLWDARSPALRGEAPPQAFVLEFTGNGTRAEEIASYAVESWRRFPVELSAMNYPGYGGSTGPARLKAAADASLVAFDDLAARAKGRPIFVVGNSLGTTAALHVAANRPGVEGLLLTNPPSLRQLIRGRFGWWNLWLVAGPVSFGIPSELDSIANAGRCSTVPAVFITSDQDEIVPLKYQSLVVDAYAGPKRVLLRENARHNDPVGGSDQRWTGEQIDWLWQQHLPTSQPSTAPVLARSGTNLP